MNTNGFSLLFEPLRKKEKQHVVVANGIDEHTIEAVAKAVELEYVSATLIGNTKGIKEVCKKRGFNGEKFGTIDVLDASEATNMAVSMVHNGEASLLMKGFVSTDVFMKAILNKETGLVQKETLLSHVAIIRNPGYYKPMIISDVAIIPLPTFEQKKVIVQYLIDVAHKIGIQMPRVAFLAATEKVIKNMPASVDASKLKELANQGFFGEAICDGPLSLDLAIDADSAKTKGYQSDVAGKADCLLFPNIEAGNIFYKTNTKFCGAETAAVVIGTDVPVILSSRGDSMETKLNSIALAALLSKNQ
jgi:phosphotransacetylase